MKYKTWCVYCHTNIKNNKKYFGITCNKPQRRWRCDGSGYKNSLKFYNSIQKYGWENFTHEILFDELDEKRAKNIEIELISKQRNNFGRDSCYNITDGGDGVRRRQSKEEKINRSNTSKFKKPVYQISLNGEIIRLWESFEQIKRETGWKYISEISACVNHRGNSNTAKGFIWILKNEYDPAIFNAKEYTDKMLFQQILQISNENKILKEYLDINDVILKNKKFKKSSIYCVLNSKEESIKPHRTVYGYVWIYKKDYNKKMDYSGRFKVRNDKYKNKVKMLDKDTKEVIRIFESVSEASKHVNCRASNITACCKGRQKTSKGYIFEYLD